MSEQFAYDEDAHWAAERTKMENADYEKWAAEHAEELFQQAYQTWLEGREDDQSSTVDDFIDSMDTSD